VINGWSEAPAARFLRPERQECLLCQSAAAEDCVIDYKTQITSTLDSNLPSLRTGVIVEQELLTRDVLRICIRLDRSIEFLAGQFVLLEIPEIHGVRAYSLANTQNSAPRIDLIVKRKPGGDMTEWLFSGDRINQIVRIFGPIGRSVFDPTTDQNLLFIVGGSGIAGACAILSRAAATGHLENNNAVLFFGVRTEGDAFLLDWINSLRQQFAGFKATVAISDEVPSHRLVAQYPDINFEFGLIHQVASAYLSSECKDTTAFLAGPPPMVDAAIRELVVKAKLSPRHIRYDKFS
jgi:toluene monooxygenase electron transfer component